MARSIDPERAEALWDRMDDTGYAGGLGNNKPAITLLVQQTHPKLNSEEGGLVSPGEIQPLLMPMNPWEQKKAGEIIANKRLQPNGRYRRSRRGVFSPIDYSIGMRDQTDNDWRRSR